MNNRVLGFFFAVVIGCAITVQAQQAASPASYPVSEPLPPVPGKVFLVTPRPGFQNEPSISVNPANPSQVFAAYQEPAAVVFSRDGGNAWMHAAGTASTDYKLSGDVATTYDKHGAAILCYIAFDKLGTANYWAHGATRNGIFIRRSLDGGATWEKQEYTVIAQPTRPGIPFEDKPGIAADTTNSKYAGNLYVGWTEFRSNESVILFSRSTDGGVTWSSPIDISTHHGLPRDDNGAVEGFSAAVGSDGTLYSVWADGDTIAFASSRDGGKSFSRSRSIILTAPLYFDMAGMDRANGFPQIGMDRRGGKLARLWVTWSDYRTGDVGVYCSTSTDGGQSWSQAVRVNSNPVHDGTDQFFQWLSVDPVTGVANIIFYDRRMDRVNDRKTTVTLARSTNHGESFTNYAWTRAPFVPTQREFLGDYIGLAALNNRVYGAWAETVSTSQPGTPEKASGTRLPHRSIMRIGVADFASNAIGK